MTSVNSIGPEGRGGVGLADGSGLALAVSDGVVMAGVSVRLQEDAKNRINNRQNKTGVSRIRESSPGE